MNADLDSDWEAESVSCNQIFKSDIIYFCEENFQNSVRTLLNSEESRLKADASFEVILGNIRANINDRHEPSKNETLKKINLLIGILTKAVIEEESPEKKTARVNYQNFTSIYFEHLFQEKAFKRTIYLVTQVIAKALSMTEVRFEKLNY